MKLDNSIAAVVTGAASGLGAAVAVNLAEHGVRVAVLDMDEERGAAQAAAIDGLYVRCDVGDSKSVASALKIAREALGQEQICVNCAGIAAAETTVYKGLPHDPDLFAKIVRVNLIGTFNMASQSAAGMTATDRLAADGERGVIVNTASIAAFDGQIGHIAYSASKAGVAGMTLPMARDLARVGIRVLTIAPGIFETPMATQLLDDAQQAALAQVPFPSRFGKPVEFAALVTHCVENTMLNGETIRIDGAYRMPPK
mgnify:CR=1 FL=1